MKREDLMVAGVLLGTVALIGLLAWALKKRGGGSTQFKLRRVSGPQVVLRNLERTEIIRDREGRIKELVVHREVRQ